MSIESGKGFKPHSHSGGIGTGRNIIFAEQSSNRKWVYSEKNAVTQIGGLKKKMPTAQTWWTVEKKNSHGIKPNKEFGGGRGGVPIMRRYTRGWGEERTRTIVTTSKKYVEG